MSKVAELKTSEAKVLLSRYVDRMVQKGEAPDPQPFLESCPDEDKETLPFYIDGARLLHATISEIQTPPEEEFERIWTDILERLEDLGETQRS